MRGKRFRTCGEAETFRLGEAAGRSARPGEVWSLCGELGAGKTAFVRGLAAGLGVEGTVTSPTFTLQNVYEGRLPLFHFDWYRLEASREAEDLGWCEWIGKGGVTAVEWGDRFPALMPEGTLHLRLSIVSEEERELLLEGDSRSRERMEEIAACWRL